MIDASIRPGVHENLVRSKEISMKALPLSDRS